MNAYAALSSIVWAITTLLVIVILFSDPIEIIRACKGLKED